MLEEGSNKPKYCQQVSNVLDWENIDDFSSALNDKIMLQFKNRLPILILFLLFSLVKFIILKNRVIIHYYLNEQTFFTA